jgi:hypothetical protein
MRDPLVPTGLGAAPANPSSHINAVYRARRPASPCRFARPGEQRPPLRARARQLADSLAVTRPPRSVG